MNLAFNFQASQGRTTVIVAHRLSTIRNADKIVVLKDGKVVEVGDHKNLMTFKGHYYALVTLQMGSLEQGKFFETMAFYQRIILNKFSRWTTGKTKFRHRNV